MSDKRIPTGIPDLDALIEGGLREGKTYLVAGQPGTGKSVLSLQFLMRGLKEKEKCLYVAIDEKPADVIEQAASLGWDLAPFIESKEFLILDASAYFGGRVGEPGKGVDVQRVAADLNSYIARMGAVRVVIDPVGPLLSAHNPEQARLLIYAMQANASTTHLLTTYASEKPQRGVEEYLVAGTIVLEMERVDGHFQRKLTIEKMRGTALQPAQYEFNIVAERGIVFKT
jgi:circadian clock protein KaiC